MTDCGCDTARAKLEDYLHGELATQDCCDIEDHVKSCSPCGEELIIGQSHRYECGAVRRFDRKFYEENHRLRSGNPAFAEGC